LIDDILDRKNLYRAFLHVQENHGCRGADGMTLEQFAGDLDWELDRLQDRLLRRRYRPFPLLQIAIPKRSGGERLLRIPTLRDRVAQTAVDLVVRPIFEAEFEDCSYAFRQGRSVRDALRKVCELRDQGFRWLLDADIDDCFGSIPHGRLLEKLGRLEIDDYVLRLFDLWVKAEVYDGRSVFIPERGLPQGSVVSPLLANLFLDELDESFVLFEQAIVRYADDFLVLCRDRQGAEGALEVTDALLEGLGLELERQKSSISSFDQGFKFLGALFVADTVYLPLAQRGEERHRLPHLPAPLDLWTYLELKAAG
jgi:group II intron reverse transcriptase/maturase